MLVWLHLALTSIRHAPFFAMAAAPALAALVDGLPIFYRKNWKPETRLPAWAAAMTVAVVCLTICRADLGGFDRMKWPLPALAALDTQPISAHLFHEQDWGGLIAAECQPARHTLLMTDSSLFGKKAIVEYVAVLTGGPAWDDVRDRDQIKLVWLRPDRGLAKRLRKEPGWKVLYEDMVSVLLKQAPEGRIAAR